MVRPVHAAWPHVVYLEPGLLLAKVQQRSLDLPFDATEDGCEHARRLCRPFARDMYEYEGRVGVECGKCFCGREGIFVCDFEVFSGSIVSYRVEIQYEEEHELLPHRILGNALRPHTSLGVLQLLKKGLLIVLVVCMDDDFGFVVSLCHLYWSSAKDRNAADALLGEHIVKNRCANKASSACKYEMHIAVIFLGIILSFKIFGCSLYILCSISSGGEGKRSS